MLQKVKNILQRHHLRHTSFREQVLLMFLENPKIALSQSNIESSLEAFDRITLYRTMKSFVSAGVLHKAIDGGEELKYALCHEDCNPSQHNDDHPHFLCQKCGSTYCLDDVHIPSFQLPDNYKLLDIQLAISGICDRCNVHLTCNL